MNLRAIFLAVAIPTLLVAFAVWQSVAHLRGDTAAAATPALSVQTKTAHPVAKAKPMTMAPRRSRAKPYGTTALPYTLDHGVKVFHLVARPAKWRVDTHTVVHAWTYNGQVPGPLLRFRQGDRVRVVVTNKLSEPTAVHWHGLDVPNAMDGVPGVTMKAIKPGKSFTYSFTVVNAPGLYIYHPHYDTLKQEGLGMYGALIVDPKTGTPRGVHEMIQVLSSFGGSYLINGKSFPSTDAYSLPAGSTGLIRMINMDTAMNHPMHLHGVSFTEVGANGGAIPRRLQRKMDEQDVAPGEAFDMRFDATHKGVWLLHCHNLTHVTGPNGADAGMITVLKVT